MEIQFNLLVFGVAALSVPFVLGLYVRCFRHQQRALGEFFGRRSLERYLANGRRRWTRVVCVIIAVLLLTVAVSQPQWGSQIESLRACRRTPYRPASAQQCPRGRQTVDKP